ncbi:TasA family protein [Brevibacillus ginsengisoli]|uniref:TasA family protein n=1 Tax=Brevibacillus ginsengisoli TaxID=363854 RepID=UPI003CEFD1BC
MGLTKQFALTLASLGLGAALVGGGTFAWFNSTQAIEKNKFEAGTLDMKVAAVNGYQMNFDLSNLKPGDYMTRRFNIINTGSLDIKEVLMSLNFDPMKDFHEGQDSNGKENTNNPGDRKASALDYLNQYQIDVFRTEADSPYNTSDMDLLRQLKWRVGKSSVTLKDLYELCKTDRFDIAYRNLLNPKPGSQQPDNDVIEIKLSFVNNDQKNADGTYLQNKYQGDSIKVAFMLEGTQFEGINRKENGDKPPILID